MNISDISSQNALYYLNLTSYGTQNSTTQLASGSKLSIPSNDPAGAAVASQLDSTTLGLNAASQNVQNLTSFAQTSDGYLSVIQGQLGQLSTLAVRSTDGTLSASDRSAINDEFTKIRDQINNQIQNASFNGTNVFDTTNTVSAAVDASGSNSYTLSIANASQDVAGLASSNVLTSSAAQAALNDVTTAIQNIATSRSQVNADVATLSNTSDNIQTQQINTEKAASQISDADYAQQTTTLAKNNILNQASVAMLGQANLSAQTVLGLLA